MSKGTNPFNDLDNLMLSHLLGFIDAFDALRLATTSRRMYYVHRSTLKLRRFDFFDFVHFNSNNANSVEMQLQNGPKPTTRHRNVYVQFWMEPTRTLPDGYSHFVLVDGEVTIRIQYRRLRPLIRIWRCRVQPGQEEDATQVLLKFFTERFTLNHLQVYRTDAKRLTNVAKRVPERIDSVSLALYKLNTEQDVLDFLEKAPSVRKIELTGRMPNVFSMDFFTDENICRLREFVSSMGSSEISDDAVHKIRFTTFDSQEVGFSPFGLKKILEEWKNDLRDIHKWSFFIKVNSWEWPVRKIAKLLLGDNFDDDEDVVDAAVKSKSGRELEVQLAKCVNQNSLVFVEFQIFENLS